MVGSLQCSRQDRAIYLCFYHSYLSNHARFQADYRLRYYHPRNSSHRCKNGWYAHVPPIPLLSKAKPSMVAKGGKRVQNLHSPCHMSLTSQAHVDSHSVCAIPLSISTVKHTSLTLYLLLSSNPPRFYACKRLLSRQFGHGRVSFSPPSRWLLPGQAWWPACACTHAACGAFSFLSWRGQRGAGRIRNSRRGIHPLLPFALTGWAGFSCGWGFFLSPPEFCFS